MVLGAGLEPARAAGPVPPVRIAPRHSGHFSGVSLLIDVDAWPKLWRFFAMPKDIGADFSAVQVPLSEFFDAYAIVGYKAGTHERVAFMNCPDPIARDGLARMVDRLSERLADAETITDTDDEDDDD